MKTFIIQERFTGYADIHIEADTEEEALSLYNRGHYKDSQYFMDDMFYNYQFDSISEMEDQMMGIRRVDFNEEQFETLFNFVNDKVESIVNASVDYNDSEILNEWEDLLDVHTVLEEANKWVTLTEDD